MEKTYLVTEQELLNFAIALNACNRNVEKVTNATQAFIQTLNFVEPQQIDTIVFASFTLNNFFNLLI